MSEMIKCDLCEKLHENWGPIGPVFLSLGLLNTQTQANFIQVDLCMPECWPRSRKQWKDAFMISLKTQMELPKETEGGE